MQNGAGLTIVNSTLKGNHSGTSPGGAAVRNRSPGVLAVDSSTLVGNTIGGIYSGGGSVTVSNSTISGSGGAGVTLENTTASLTAVTLSNNHGGNVVASTSTVDLDRVLLSISVVLQTPVTLVSPPPPPPGPPPPPPPRSPPPPPPPRCVVPNVQGKTVKVARPRIAAAHCRVGRMSRKYSARVRKGRVISEAPRPGRRLAANAKVKLVVSRGRRLHA